MDNAKAKIQATRDMLVEAQEAGGGATLLAYLRLSGPGWLQSAITLGGGSLAGALFLGVLGGFSLLWLQLVAITMGVIMLSAISYVTLSIKERPFEAINRHINPVLGWGWLLATVTANIIWCMPQFSLCYAALQKNLVGARGDGESGIGIGNSLSEKLAISGAILVAATIVVLANRRQGLAAKLFDLFLKFLVGMVVVCFFGVVVYLIVKEGLPWGEVLGGFIPDLSPWTQPAGRIPGLLEGLPASVQEFWTERVVKEQRAVMIGAAATAVGINMTFLMPYALLSRHWDKPFRGLARFDLGFGMAIPYVLVTSCVVIAAASRFHAPVDDALVSNDLSTMQSSPIYGGARKILVQRLESELGSKSFAALSDSEVDARIADLPTAEKRVVASLVKRDAFQLSKALSPLLGEDAANIVFGLGVFGMGFSSIIILMLINGYAFCEMTGSRQGGTPYVVGCLVSGVAGASWPLIWDGPAKLWLAILVSSFGMMLLPIAYCTFFMMMNSKSLMGADKPRGLSMTIWNVLMGISVLGAIAAAATAIYDKANNPTVGPAVIGGAVVFVLLAIVGFFFRQGPKAASTIEYSQSVVEYPPSDNP